MSGTDPNLRDARSPLGRLPSAALATALATAALLGGCHREPVKRPNVLVVLVDALRADALGVNGYPLPTTPRIDQLAAEGVNFSAAISVETWTKPSIATLFTGLHPGEHGIGRVGFETEEGLATEVLSDHLVTLAERFQAAGYATGAVINQVHLNPRFGFAQGFDTYTWGRGRTAPQLNRDLLAWLDETPQRPFFAYLHYLDAHWPYDRVTKGEQGSFGATAMVSPPPSQGNQADAWAETMQLPGDLAALRARYDQEVAWADRAIGVVVDGLAERGLLEDTLIVVTADHGESFLEHGRLMHGWEPYDEVLRVPLVIRPPGGRASALEIEEPVGLLDLMPTLLDLAGLAPEPQCQGRSLAPLLRGETLPERPLFVQGGGILGVRTAAAKLLLFPDGHTEFFDLAADPGETAPAIDRCDGPCRPLATALRAHRAHVESLVRDDGESAPLSEEDIEELRALGYLD